MFFGCSDVVSDVEQAQSAAVSGRSSGIFILLVIVAVAAGCCVPF
jgi:hypothetical protein